MNISSANNPVASQVAAEAHPAYPPASAAQRRALAQAVTAVNQAGLFGEENELTIAIDRTTRRPVVRIVNRDTHQTIQQIPAQYILQLAEEYKGR